MSVSGTFRPTCSTYAVGRALFVLCTVFTLLVALPAWAICEAGGASQPSVGLSYSGPNQFGNGTVSVSFGFPNTNHYLQRYLDFFRDGVLWNSTYVSDEMLAEGVWSFPHSVACLATGSHSMVARARACDQFVATAATSVAVNTTPTVSISTFGPNAAGNTTVSVSYSFPNTSSYLNRLIDVYRDGVHWWAEYQPNTSGVLVFSTPGTCAATWLAVATACDRFGDPLFRDEDVEEAPDRKPEVKSVALLKVGLEPLTQKAIIQATVVYDLKNPNGTVQVDLENWVDADGQQHAGYTLQTFNVPGNLPSDTKVFTFTAPSGAQQVSVLAKATTICGTAKKAATIECPTCPGASANPVYYSDGNMRLSDGDPLPPVAGRSLVRTYNSDEQVVALFGRGWTTLLDRRLIVHTDAVSVTTETNEVVRFDNEGGVWRQTWPTARRELGRLTYDGATGTYAYRAPGATEVVVFRATDGRLVAIRDAATAREAVIGYDAQGRPATVTDIVTEVTWNLTFDGAQRRVTSVGVAGHPDLVWNYSYDGNGNLMSVLAPGGSPWRTYEYAANRMSASRDALGNLIESHTYDANGYAVSSTGDVDEIANIQYGLPGSVANERLTRVTYKSGAVAEHRLRPVGNGWRPVHVTGGCASCGTNDATYVHDERGRAIREQGADGYVTATVYSGDHVLSEERSLKPVGCDPQIDSLRCRLGTDALAAAVLESTSTTVRTTFAYGDALWPDRITGVTRPSVRVPGQVRREDTVYHSVTGAVVSTSVDGWTGEEPTDFDRTMRTTFYGDVPPCGPDGCPPYDPYAPAFTPGGAFQSAWLTLPQPSRLPKSIDGARTDVQDVSSLVYYPIDPTVPALLRGRLAATKNAAGHITRYENYDVFGNLTRVVDPNGVAREMTYDTLGRPVTSTTKGVVGCNTVNDPLCATDLTATRAYTSVAGPLRLDQRPGGGVTVYAYDARGRVQTVSRGPAEGDLRERIETTYDALTGKKSLERTLAFETGAWVEKQRQTFAYDSRARLQTVTHADGAAIHYTYDAEDRVATMRDENHAAPNTTYAYDPAGRLESVRQTLAGAPGGIITTRYAYDTNGNLTSVTDPNGNVTGYAYDDFGQMTSQQSPVTGATTYAYDSAGNLLDMTDANGATTTRQYDSLSRVHSAVSTANEEEETVSWTYDTGPFAAGRLSSMNDPSGTTSYAYDRRGLLVEEYRAIEGANLREYTTRFRYDADGNRAAIVYPSGDQATYTHDHSGRPRSVSVEGVTIVSEASYLPFGPRRTLTYGNGMVQTMQYDSRYRIDTNVLSGPLGTMASYDYGWDAKGNVTSIADLLDSGYDRSYAYDDLDRLTGAASGGALWGSGSYSYDAMGNVLQSTLGSSVTSFAYQGTTPKLLTVTTGAGPRPVTYDAAGNETAAGTTISPRNQVIAYAGPSARLEYVYDGRGVRTTRYQNRAGISWTIAHTVYTPELQILSTKSYSATAKGGETTTGLRQIVWFGGTPVAQLDGLTAPRTLRYTFTDHLGTPLLQTNTAGQIVWRAEYDPYGTIAQQRAGTSDEQRLRFPGQEAEAGSDLYYNIFRWYGAGWGRYTQNDPDRQNAPFHPYDYANGNPLRWSDPRGLKAFNMFEAPPNLPSMPGSLPNKSCCSTEAIQKATDNVDYQIDRMMQGKMPAGNVVAMTISPTLCINGTCSSYPVDPKEYVFIKTYSKDPCVNYCINFHEFLHFTDTRAWDISWGGTKITLFTEFFPYVGEKSCLMQFGGK